MVFQRGKEGRDGYTKSLRLTDTYLYIKQINNKDLLCVTGNRIPYLVIMCNEKEPKKEYIYV